ncbi:MAG: T9SS type A sorting domain-containing protein [Saprospiraceae bacterium]
MLIFLAFSINGFAQITFTEHYNTRLPNDTYTSIHPADMDSDGDLDLVAVLVDNGDEIITWFENVGVGSDFIRHDIAAGNSGLSQIAIADFDGDDDNDIVAIAVFDDEMTYYSNLDNGINFSETLLYTAEGFYGMEAIDTDLDGDMDLVFSSYITLFEDETFVWENPGNGDFLSVNKRKIADVKSNLIKGGDFDEDGDVDLLLYENSLELYLNDGSGTYQASTISSGVAYESIEVADVDNDGDLDINLGSVFGKSLTQLVNNYPNFDSKTIQSSIRVDNFTSSDFDKDGNLDYVIIDENDGILYLFTTEDGTTYSSEILTEDFLLNSSLFAADFNNDDKPDIAACNIRGLYIFENTTMTSILENPNNFDISIFPNPTFANIYISRSNELELNSFVVHNILGNQSIVGNLNASQNLINVGSLPKGIYTLSIIGKSGELVTIPFQKY